MSHLPASNPKPHFKLGWGVVATTPDSGVRLGTSAFAREGDSLSSRALKLAWPRKALSREREIKQKDPRARAQESKPPPSTLPSRFPRSIKEADGLLQTHPALSNAGRMRARTPPLPLS